MSRSYKKNPICNDGTAGGTKEQKRFANKKVRRTSFEDLPLVGRSYRKVFCSYDIHDYVFRQTWQEALEDYRRDEWLQQRYTEKEFYRRWYKYYKRK